MRIALIATCLGDALFPDVPKATVALLERLGHEVVFPPAQVCCGQMHVNTGYLTEALPVVRHHVEVFSARRLRRRGGAVGIVRGVDPAPARDGRPARPGTPPWPNGRPRWPPGPTNCRNCWSTCSGVTDVGAYYPHRVTYHPTCHSLRMLRVGDKPLSLLRAVEGIDLVDLPQADTCCGFGGTFALKNSDTSSAMLADKMTQCAVHRRRGLLGRRLVLPDAHRRRPVPQPTPGVRTVHLAADPGVHQGEPGMSAARSSGVPAA